MIRSILPPLHGPLLAACLVLLGGCGSATTEGDATPSDTVDAQDSTPDAETDPGPEVTEAPPWPTVWEVRVSPEAPAAVVRAAEQAVELLEGLGLEATLLRVDGKPDCVSHRGQLVLAGDGLGQVKLEAQPATPQSWRIEEVRCGEGGSGTFVATMGGGTLGRQVAVWRWFERLGVAFPHPEETIVPASPRWPVEPVVHEATPAVPWRAVRRDPAATTELDEPADGELDRWLDWLVRIGASAVDVDGLPQAAVDRAAGMGLGRQRTARIYAGEATLASARTPKAWLAARLAAPVERLVLRADGAAGRAEVDVLADLEAITGTALELDPTLRLAVAVPATSPLRQLVSAAPTALGVEVELPPGADLFRPAPPVDGEPVALGDLYGWIVQQGAVRPVGLVAPASSAGPHDLAVPLYLPIGMDARARDLAALAHLAGEAPGLTAFTSVEAGLEWGAWQQVACGLRLAGAPNEGLAACLDRIVGPLGEAAATARDVLGEAIALQDRDLLFGGLWRWLLAEPPVPHADIASWDLPAVEDWHGRVAPRLAGLAVQTLELWQRLVEAQGGAPPDAANVFGELADGLELVARRAEHVRMVTGAAVDLRASQLRYDAALAESATAKLAAADDLTRAARTAVRRRELGYRYAPVERAVAAGRYLNCAHEVQAFRDDEAAAAAVLMGPGAVAVADALLGPGDSLEVAAGEGATVGSLTFGDGAATTSLPATHDYAEPGIWRIEASGEVAGEPWTFGGRVATLTEKLMTGATGHVLEPEGVELIDPAFPALTFGRLDDGAVAVGFTLAGDDPVALHDWTTVACSPKPPLVLACGSDALVVPAKDPFDADGGWLGSITLHGASFELASDGTLAISGTVTTQVIVDFAQSLFGFEPADALDVIAGLLGVTPQTLPAQLSFAAEYAVDPATLPGAP